MAPSPSGPGLMRTGHAGAMYAYSQAAVRFAEGLSAGVPLIPQGDSITTVSIHPSSGRRLNERHQDHRRDFRRGVLVSSARGRVDGGLAEGGSSPAPRILTPCWPSPPPPSDEVNRCDRNKLLTWQRQQEVLDAQRDDLASRIRDAVTASAAIQMLDVPP